MMRSGEEKTIVQTVLQEMQMLQIITDAALRHRDLPDFFHDVLIQLQSALNVDNLAVLLIEPDGQTLKMHSVIGPEEAVSSHVVVPFGAGFAGTIAASQTPLIVERIDAFPVVNPFLRDHFWSMAGVPLMIDTHVFGVFHVGTTQPHLFSQRDMYHMERIAAKFSLVIDRATLRESERQARQLASARIQELEKLLDAIADAVMVYDQVGHLTQCNAAARQLFGLDMIPNYENLTIEERLNIFQTWDIQGKSIPFQELPPCRLLRGENLSGIKAVAMMIQSLGGSRIIINVTGNPLYNDEGQIVGAICTARDVTERYHSQQAIIEFLAVMP